MRSTHPPARRYLSAELLAAAIGLAGCLMIVLTFSSVASSYLAVPVELRSLSLQLELVMLALGVAANAAVGYKLAKRR